MKSKQTIWMHPERIYIVSGGSSANSLLFEDLHCHSIFFQYFNRFLSDMVKVLHYKMTPTGWVMAIKTKSEKEITAAYLTQRRKSQKADRTKDLAESKRMISEHFRMFLSNFVKMTNCHLGREGVLVKKRFSKCMVSTEEEYYRQFELICDLNSCNYRQTIEKYQADEYRYDEAKELVGKKGELHPCISSSGLYSGNLKMADMPMDVIIVRPFSDVLRKILRLDKNNKNPENHLPKRE